jgi:hypothetical protein
MGAATQTINNGLKPYGMIYELIKKEKIPVYWIINPIKSKDGIDFTYNGINYRGGTFVIPQEYITASAQAKIANWQGKGVLGSYTSSSLTLTPTYRLTSVPNWTLDSQNGSIAEDFLLNAGIPNTGYNWLSPAELDICNDLLSCLMRIHAGVLMEIYTIGICMPKEQYGLVVMPEVHCQTPIILQMFQSR